MARKTVLVTGASRGIGKAIAVKFAKKGYNVIINCAHREAELLQAQKEIENYQVSCTAFLGDMGDFDTCEKLFRLIRKQYGTLDVLVNNAGIAYIGLLQDMTGNDWQRILNTNLTSVFNCCKLAIPMMVSEKQGKIINISSVSGILGNAGQANYSASKAGLIGLTKSVARELASRGICVNAVAPGFVDTEMTRAMSEKVREDAVKTIPLGRMGSVEDIAQTVVFLAGSTGDYITGQVFCVDGGLCI